MSSSRDIRREIDRQQQELDTILDQLGDELEYATAEFRATLEPTSWLEKPLVWAVAGGLLALLGIRRALARRGRRRDLEAALRHRLEQGRRRRLALPLPRRGS